MPGERTGAGELTSGRAWQASLQALAPLLHGNEPPLRQSRGELIRGTARAEAQLRGTGADDRQFPLLLSLRSLGATAEFGEQKGTGRGASGLLIV